MPSYGTNEGYLEYVAASGRCNSGVVDPELARRWGTAYVDSFEDMYRGTALAVDNSFPRDLWPVVPEKIEWATYEAGLAWADGVALFGSGGSAGGQVIREKVDVLEVQYAAPQDGQGYWEMNRFILPAAYALLLPFFKRKGGFYPSALVV